MTNYRQEFERYKALPFEERRLYVLSLLEKIKDGSEQ